MLLNPEVEYLEVYDESGAQTHKIYSRKEVHTYGYWHKTIHLWLINNQGELLLQKRALTKDTNPGLWDISVAGHISSGQTVLEALVRETQEEIGYQINPANALFLFQNKNQFQCRDVIDNEWQEVYIAKCNRTIAELTFPSEEISALKWMSWKELRNKVNISSAEFVEHSVEYQKLFSFLEYENNVHLTL
jgi:isopentenyldiphosphate isomerase